MRALARAFLGTDSRFASSSTSSSSTSWKSASKSASSSNPSNPNPDPVAVAVSAVAVAAVGVPSAMCAPFGLGGGKKDASVESEIKPTRGNKSGATAAFDPEALERGAKALREINASPYATKVLDLSRTQEQTKQGELRAREAEANATAAAHATEREKVMWSEQSRLEKERSQQAAQLKQYDDELARKRLATDHEQRRQRNAEMVKLQEEGVERQEAIKRATEEKIQRERSSNAKTCARKPSPKPRAASRKIERTRTSFVAR